jgi:hypothetical protein
MKKHNEDNNIQQVTLPFGGRERRAARAAKVEEEVK